MEAGSFSVLARLGEGPFGTLYEGRRRDGGERAVVRVLPPGLAQDAPTLTRLAALQRALAKLEPERSSAFVVQSRDSVLARVYESGQLADGSLFLVCEYVPGESLANQLRRHAGLPLPNKALRIGRQIAAVLSVAHTLNVRHLALRPHKVMLVPGATASEGEQVRLLDVGLLEACSPGLRPAQLPASYRPYLAPEVRRGDLSSGGLADVYSLAVVLYEIAAGRVPQSALEQGTAPPPGAEAQTGLMQMLPSWLQPFAGLLDRMLSRAPDDRPTMAQVAAMLQQLSSMAPSTGTSGIMTPTPSAATPRMPLIAANSGPFRLATADPGPQASAPQRVGPAASERIVAPGAPVRPAGGRAGAAPGSDVNQPISIAELRAGLNRELNDGDPEPEPPRGGQGRAAGPQPPAGGSPSATSLKWSSEGTQPPAPQSFELTSEPSMGFEPTYLAPRSAPPTDPGSRPRPAADDDADAIEISAAYTLSESPTLSGATPQTGRSGGGRRSGGRRRSSDRIPAPNSNPDRSDEAFEATRTPGEHPATGIPTAVEPGIGNAAILQPGQLVGNFRVTAKIGQGGMGAVYSAVHRQIGRRAAVKVLHGPLARSADYAQRFLNEARAVNILRHPGLVEIFDFGQLPDGTLYIIMEFLEGESLRSQLKKKGKLGEQAAIDLALQLARALDSAHQKGIVHRDLKPENVMLIVDPVRPELDRVKILDFGIAKVGQQEATPEPEAGEFLTAVGTTMGTPKYMAPEQYGDAGKVDGKADVFALGVMLYEMVAGQVPFAKTSLAAFATPPTPLPQVAPDVSPKLAALVHRMLSPKPAERPKMHEVIEALATDSAASKRTDQVAVQPQVQQPPPRSWVGVVAVLALLGVVLVGVGVYLGNLARQPADGSLAQVDQNDLEVDIAGPKARALGVLYLGLRATEPALRAQAARALGESRDVAQWSSVASLLKDPDAVVQSEAAAALGQLGAPEAQAALIQALDANPPAGVRAAIAGALARLQQTRGTVVLRELVQQPDERLKLRAALLLLESGDMSATSTLREALGKPGLPEDVSLRILSRLAQTGDSQAQQQLGARMAGDDFSLKRISAAGTLARTGDDRARAVLTQAAQKPGPHQLLAGLMLATVGDATGFGLFRATAIDPKRPVDARQVAIEGLGACGRRHGALALVDVLDESTAPTSLRQAAAGAILKISGGDPDQVAKQSLGWAQSALGHDDWLVRESATAVLGDLENDQALPLLTQALSDAQRDVRKSAATALGRKRARAALWALRVALSDAETEVRIAGMRSLGKIAAALGPQGAADEDTMAKLRQLAEAGSPEDQVVAAGTLIQLGDASQRERLRAGLGASDPLIRKLVVEMVGPGDPALTQALTDPAMAVRFAAARRLVSPATPNAHKQAKAVLHEVLAQGGADSVIAYGLLKKLGESVVPPAGFGDLLSRGDLPTSLALLDLVADLPPADALPILQKARFDSAAQVRRRVGEVAFRFYKSAPGDELLSLLYGLVSDPDMGVRTRVAALMRDLTHKPTAVPAPDLSPGAPADAAPASPADLGDEAADAGTAPAAPGRGYLRIVGEEKVRYQIDQHAVQSVGSEAMPLELSPGRHQIRYATGAQTFMVTEKNTAVVQLPLTLADQLLVDAAEATQRREFARAQQTLDRVRGLVVRGKAGRGTQAELIFQQARLFEAQQRWLDAMREFERLLKLPDTARRPEHVAAARTAAQTVGSHLGRIQVSKAVDGRCVLIDEWVRPGEHVLDEGGGQSRIARVREGQVYKIQLCQGAVAP